MMQIIGTTIENLITTDMQEEICQVDALRQIGVANATLGLSGNEKTNRRKD